MKCSLCGEEMQNTGYWYSDEEEEEIYICSCGMQYGTITSWYHNENFKKIEEEEN